jgi:hypothetical protein
MSVLLTFQGTDETMLAKVHKAHEGNKNYLKPKSDKIPAFGLSHFAGTVFYDVKGKYYVDNSDAVLTKTRIWSKGKITPMYKHHGIERYWGIEVNLHTSVELSGLLRSAVLSSGNTTVSIE